MCLPNERANAALQLVCQIDIYARARIRFLFLGEGQAVASHVFPDELREVDVTGESRVACGFQQSQELSAF
jgi:hypothetical protein